MTHEERQNLLVIETSMKSPLTEEQREFAANFTVPTISFASPGTGKTYTLVAGVLQALTLHNIDGNKMRVLSFTNNAVNEIAARYLKVSESYQPYLRVKDRSKPFANPKFSTIHSFAREILTSVAPDIKIVDKINFDEDVPYIAELLQSKNMQPDLKFARRLLDNFQRMNSAFIYSKEHCEQDYGFKNLHMDYDIFTEIRMRYFSYKYMMKKIHQGDIPCYALYVLHSRPEVYEKWHNKFDVIVVDEFQDMTILYLNLLSVITKSIVAVGDMKQQIYIFNGASVAIQYEFLKMFPDARQCPLTQSFRCSKKIAEFSNNLLHNSMLIPQDFVGTSEEGSVEILKYNPQVLRDLATQAKEGNLKDTMFLFRLKASVVPIVDELYTKEIPFQCPDYQPVTKVPFIEELCTIMEAACDPTNAQKVDKALRLLPEFQRAPWGKLCYPAKTIEDKCISWFDLPESTYRVQSTKEIVEAAKRAADADLNNAPAAETLNYIMQVYGRYVSDPNSWKYPMEPSYYVSVVASVLKKYSYTRLCRVERDKLSKIEIYKNAPRAVRCYTCHASKGLEAENVYVIDADDQIFPQPKKISKQVEANCIYSAACDVQAERNLLYVASTRAKKTLKIFYATEPASIISFDTSRYASINDSIRNIRVDFPDVDAFKKVVKIE